MIQALAGQRAHRKRKINGLQGMKITIKLEYFLIFTSNFCMIEKINLHSGGFIPHFSSHVIVDFLWMVVELNKQIADLLYFDQDLR
jgi:hypothetical protein